MAKFRESLTLAWLAFSQSWLLLVRKSALLTPFFRAFTPIVSLYCMLSIAYATMRYPLVLNNVGRMAVDVALVAVAFACWDYCASAKAAALIMGFATWRGSNADMADAEKTLIGRRRNAKLTDIGSALWLMMAIVIISHWLLGPQVHHGFAVVSSVMPNFVQLGWYKHVELSFCYALACAYSTVAIKNVVVFDSPPRRALFDSHKELLKDFPPYLFVICGVTMITLACDFLFGLIAHLPLHHRGSHFQEIFSLNKLLYLIVGGPVWLFQVLPFAWLAMRIRENNSYGIPLLQVSGKVTASPVRLAVGTLKLLLRLIVETLQVTAIAAIASVIVFMVLAYGFQTNKL